MGEEGYITLYSGQRREIGERLQAGQTYYVQRRFIRQKYGESAASFLAAYQWYTGAAQALVPKEKQAESAVWAFADAAHAAPGQDSCLLTLRVPQNEVVLFDVGDWNRILNALPLGSGEERRAYEDNLAKLGIIFPSDVVTTGFYPAQKQQLLKSWHHLFDNHAAFMWKSAALPPKAQAGLWKIEPGWVVDCVCSPV